MSKGALIPLAGKKSKVSSSPSPQRKLRWYGNCLVASRLHSAYASRNGVIDGTQTLGEYSCSNWERVQERHCSDFAFGSVTRSKSDNRHFRLNLTGSLL